MNTPAWISHPRYALICAAIGACALLAAGCVGRGNGNSTGPSQNDSTAAVVARQAQTPIEPSCDKPITPQIAVTRADEKVAVAGNVVVVEQPSGTDSATILDLGAAYPDAGNLSIVIPQAKVALFPDNLNTLFSGKNICVVGVVETYQQRNAIIINAPDDIAVTSPS
ncbi:MAG TPA: hypothetical protein VFY79_14515 [Dehalococcoidia bacterium]|jgi:hypothetical protein|nr:hypothetical protein [Dehalococcoidia bacterium]